MTNEPFIRPVGECADSQRADVVVVGARCTGAATAMLLGVVEHDPKFWQPCRRRFGIWPPRQR